MHSNVSGETLENVVGSQGVACANPTEKTKQITSKKAVNFLFILYPRIRIRPFESTTYTDYIK